MGDGSGFVREFVSLDDVGLGNAYLLGPGEGQHSAANGGWRTLLTRGADTHGDVGVMMCSGNETTPTMPHLHRRTTELVFALDGVTRVWLDDQNGTRIVRDVVPGEFAVLPRDWIHAWAFMEPNSRQLGIMAPGGFEKIVDFLDPNVPTSIERLRESEKHLDVVWTPEFPLFGDTEELLAAVKAG